MQVVIKVAGDPDFHLDHLDLEAPPPAATPVNIDGRWFTVAALTLKSRVYPSGRRSYYEATLRPAEQPERDDNV